jgi:putative Mg2+ transporter-C (MgtC) family protein
MDSTITYILNILVAALLGGAIGLEREFRAKEAGFRTHFLVGLGSALFMILSAHGFDAVVGTPGVRLDPSRIAAQVVSGIGFIGAGTIILQKHAVRGLTTAAGLWVTSAIGMTSGAGMYLLASTATVLVLLCLEGMNVIHRRLHGSQHADADIDEKEEQI